MTGSIALDVFIGLVFIYLTYSLLATIIMEIIATNLGFRARNLKVAITRMLSDEKFNWHTSFKHFAKRNFSDGDNSLAKKLYNTHRIARLSSGRLFSKPSAIAPQTFAEEIIAIIGSGPLSLQANIKAYMAKVPDNANGPRSTDQELAFLFESSGRKIEPFKAAIEKWYLEMVERSIGWYKRRVQLILLPIGLAMAFLLNLNTLHIATILSKSDVAREEVLKMTAEYLRNNEDPPELGDIPKEKQWEYLKQMRKQSMQLSNVISIPKQTPTELILAYKELTTKEFDTLEKPISYIKMEGKDCYLVFVQPQEMPFLNMGKFVNPEACKAYAKGDVVPFDKAGFEWKFRIPGIILTALAISLGAPFWFDLLNKLMRLKTSVYPKVEEDKTPK